MTDTYQPLPSDGVPHAIDPEPDDGQCNCTDCRVERQVEIERAVLRANQIMASAMEPKHYVRPAPPRRRRSR